MNENNSAIVDEETTDEETAVVNEETTDEETAVVNEETNVVERAGVNPPEPIPPEHPDGPPPELDSGDVKTGAGSVGVKAGDVSATIGADNHIEAGDNATFNINKTSNKTVNSNRFTAAAAEANVNDKQAEDYGLER